MISVIIHLIILFLGATIAGICEKNIAGKHIATLIFALLFAIYCLIIFVIQYVKFRKEYPKKYNYYKVKLINSTNITMEQIEANNKLYYKRFKQSLFKESFLKIIEIACAFSFAIAFIIALVK